MMMHKTDAYYENGGLPSKELIAGVGEMVGDMVAQRQAAGRRRPCARAPQGVRLKFAGGKRTVIPGPLAGDNELVAGFAVMRVHSLDEAVEWASQYAAVVGDAELDIRPANEPWDIGLGEKPEGLTTRRYIAMHKASAKTEAGTPPTPAQMEAHGRS